MSATDWRLERGLQHLSELVRRAADGPHDRNEAATRFQIIDELLVNVLAWPRQQIEPEEYSDPGFADYVLGTPHRQLVLEAKREGRHFQLPLETPLKPKLSTLFQLDSQLEAAVRQAQGYASNLGLPYAAVCNGQQLVAFLAVRIDGVAPLTGNALAFASLRSMLDNFTILWDGLSQPGVDSRRLTAILSGETAAAPPAKASTRLVGYPGHPRRGGELLSDLRTLSELFLVDMPEQPALAEAFLRDCYTNSGALSQNSAVGRNILRSRYSEPLQDELGVDIQPARTRRGLPRALLTEVAKASINSRPVILLGYVGVGKTMFIQRLIQVDAKDELTNAIILSVNLGEEPALEQLRPYITDHFLSALRDAGVPVDDREALERVYAEELAAFARGPFGAIETTQPDVYALKRAERLAEVMADRESHLRHWLEYLAEDGTRQIVTILDNVDQRPAAVQDEVFLIAATLAHSWPGTVFIALRPDTFNRSKKSGTLAAYQPRVFAVAPPRIDQVLDKRIRFAQQQITGVSGAADLLNLGDTKPLSTFLEIIRLSLRRSQALARLVDNLSGQNARRAVEILTAVLSSPHSRPERAVTVRRPARYSVPFHDFLRAVMLGQSEYFDPASSLVTNLLDISSDDGREHFLLPIIICFLRRAAEPGVNQGFVPAARLYDHCQGLAFRPEQVTWQLERAAAGGLVEVSPLDGAPELYRATAIGAYTEETLLSDFTYLDEISIDTPIVDQIVAAVIGEADVVSARIRRADRFRRYLDDQWTSLSDLESGFDWPAHSRAAREAIDNLEGRIAAVPLESPSVDE